MGVLGRPLFSERDWARHRSDAMAGRVGKVVATSRPVGAPRRSATAKFKKRTVFTTRQRTYERRRDHTEYAPNVPSDTRALKRSSFKTSAAPR